MWLASPSRAFAGLLAGLLAGTLHAAGGSSGAGANAQVLIRKAMTLTRQRDLDFGGVVVGGAAGTATLTLNPRTNGLTSSGALIVGTFNPHSRAQFRVTGTRNAAYGVILPASLTLSGSNGGTLQVTAMTFWSTTAGSGAGGALANNGRDTLRVGGTLTLPDTVVDGDYATGFNVTVAYN